MSNTDAFPSLATLNSYLLLLIVDWDLEILEMNSFHLDNTSSKYSKRVWKEEETEMVGVGINWNFYCYSKTKSVFLVLYSVSAKNIALPGYSSYSILQWKRWFKEISGISYPTTLIALSHSVVYSGWCVYFGKYNIFLLCSNVSMLFIFFQFYLNGSWNLLTTLIVA